MNDTETVELINKVVARVCDTITEDINRMELLNISRVVMAHRLKQKLENVKANPVKLQEDVGDVDATCVAQTSDERA